MKTTLPFVLGGAVLSLLICGSLALAHPGSPSRQGGMNLPLPTWGPDIRVSPPLSGSFDIQNNLTLALNPADPAQVAAAYNSLDTTSASGLAWSTDAGQTWTGQRFYGSWVPGDDLQPSGSTSIAFDRQGIAYYGSQAASYTLHGYFVLTATLGSPWSTPVPVVVTDYNEYRDQGRLAVDGRAAGQYAGSLYYAWRYSDLAGNRRIRLRYSRDSGQTWSAEAQISDPAHSHAGAPALAVAADGTVYLAYADALPPNISSEDSFYLVRSTDGGQSWQPATPIANGPIIPIGVSDFKGRGRLLPGDAQGGGFLVTSTPALAVAPADPATVYIVWNDGRWESAFGAGASGRQHGDIAFSRSTDGGGTWSAPTRVNDDPLHNGIDQYTPAVAVGPQGLISVIWYDRRENPLGYLYKPYYAQSDDGGLTWSPNIPIADQPSDPMAISNQKGEGLAMGSNGLVWGLGYVLPGWVDTRAGAVHHIYADRGRWTLPSPTPPPSPTALRTATVTPPPSSSPTVTPCPLHFGDVVPGSTFYDAIRCLSCRGIVSGYPCGGPGEPCPGQYYRPAAEVTRGQIAKILSAAAGLTDPVPSTRQTFEDAPPGSPFWVYIERLAGRGIIGGYPCGGPSEPCVAPGARPYYRPTSPVTRGQLAKIVSGAAGWTKTPIGQAFEDVPPANPFWLWIEQVARRGIIAGYPCGNPGEPCIAPGDRPYFRPANHATRGQMSKIAAQTFFPACSTPVRQ